MYFGLYQIANRHQELEEFSSDRPRDDTPSFIATLMAWLRRLLG